MYSFIVMSLVFIVIVRILGMFFGFLKVFERIFVLMYGRLIFFGFLL